MNKFPTGNFHSTSGKTTYKFKVTFLCLHLFLASMKHKINMYDHVIKFTPLQHAPLPYTAFQQSYTLLKRFFLIYGHTFIFLQQI